MTLKYLNVDELAIPPQRFLTLKGVEHPIVEQTVESFIASTKLVDQLRMLAEDDFGGQADISVKLVLLSVPSLDESALKALPLPALNKISAFIRGDFDENAAEGSEVSEKK